MSMMGPIGRRAALQAGAAFGVAVLLGLAGVAPAWADDAASVAFVKSLGDQMAAIVNGSQAEAVKKHAVRLTPLDLEYHQRAGWTNEPSGIRPSGWRA